MKQKKGAKIKRSSVKKREERRRDKTRKERRQEWRRGTRREQREKEGRGRGEGRIRCVSSWSDHTQPSSITEPTGGNCNLIIHSAATGRE